MSCVHLNFVFVRIDLFSVCVEDEWWSDEIIFKRIVLLLLSGHVIVYRNAFKASFIHQNEGGRERVREVG